MSTKILCKVVKKATSDWDYIIRGGINQRMCIHNTLHLEGLKKLKGWFALLAQKLGGGVGTR